MTGDDLAALVEIAAKAGFEAGQMAELTGAKWEDCAEEWRAASRRVVLAEIAAVEPLIRAAEREAVLHECLTACMSEYLACMNDAEDETHDNPVAKLKSRGGQDAVWKAMQEIRAIRARTSPVSGEKA